MNKELFNDLLSGKVNPTTDHFEMLSGIVDAYPYFQSAKALQLKVAKHLTHLRFESLLPKVAACTTDRKILYNYIYDITPEIPPQDPEQSDDESKNKSDKISIQNRDSQVEINPIKTSKLPKVSVKSQCETSVELPKRELQPFKDLNKNQKLSFEKWIEELKFHESQLSSQEIIDLKYSKVESFIQKNSKKNRKLGPKNEVVFDHKCALEKSELITETLAEVYLEQKKYNKAIEAYEIMILKFPQKSSFFVKKIDQIKELKN